MSNNDFMNNIEEKGGIISIDAITWNGKKVTVLACIKPGHHFPAKEKLHTLYCHFFIGYCGFFSIGQVCYCDKNCLVRKPTLKEYLKLMEEARKHGIKYNRKTNKIYRV